MSSSRLFRVRAVSAAALLVCAGPVAAQVEGPADEGAEGVAFRLPTTTTALTARQQERALSNAALHANALAVHDAGVTGRGVRINVIDTGVRATHTEFRTSRVLTSLSRDLTLSNPVAGTGITDGHGHGTYVASIAAAGANDRGFVGIAPDAQIVSSEAMSASTGWSASSTAILASVRNGLNAGTFIHNMSLAGSGPVGESAVREAVAGGTLVVAAAGNRGAANPDYPARYAKESWANGQVIAVGAVDSSNVIASFSNRAGDTADYYVVALGVNVVGAGSASDTSLVAGSGTSMATPIVSGVAALIKSRWPALQAGQVAQIIFATTTDLGAPGTDTIYGRGLVNAERAMQPVGATGARLASGSWNFGTQGTLLASSSALGSRVARAAEEGRLNTIVLDSYGRDFALDLSTAVATPRAVGFEGLASGTDRQMQFAEKTLDPLGSRVMLASEVRTDLVRADGFEMQSLANYEHRFRSREALLGAAWVQKFADGTQISLGAGGMNAFFGLQGMDTVSTQMLSQGLQSPMLGLVPMAQSAGVGLPLPGNWTVKLGIASSQGGNAVAEQLGVSGGMPLRQTLALAELNRAFEGGRTVVGMQFSNLTERESLLGGQGFGLLSTGAMATTTQALTLQAATRLTDELVAGAQFSLAHTPAVSSDGTSLMSGSTAMNASGWGFGLTRFGAFADGDRLAFTVSEPLAVRSGALEFDLPTGLAGDGSVLYRREVVSLGGAHERLWETAWVLPLSDGRAALTLSGMVRQHALGNPDAPAELLGSVRYRLAF